MRDEGVKALAVDRVTVELGGRNVVDGVSFAVERGEWVTMIGPNGAGKTSLLRAIAGLLAHRGEIRLDGRLVQELKRREVAQRVAAVPQVPAMPAGMTIREYVLLGRTPYVSYVGQESRGDVAAAETAIARLDLGGLAGRELGTLSGGERQRTVLARALAQEAPLLLLDEPTSALDAGRQQEALELIDELRLAAGLTVLAAMHDLTLAGQYASRLILLSGGRVVGARRAARGADRGAHLRALRRARAGARRPRGRARSRRRAPPVAILGRCRGPRSSRSETSSSPATSRTPTEAGSRAGSPSWALRSG